MKPILAFAVMSGEECFVEWGGRYDVYSTRAAAEADAMPEPTGELHPNKVEPVVFITRKDYDKYIGKALPLWEPLA